MLIIGLTGGIASGKSTVSSYLKKLGAYIIDADAIAKEVMEVGREGWQAVRNVFGNAYFMEDGRLDRKALAELVFSDTNALQKLNDTVHPIVKKVVCEEVLALMRSQSEKLIVLDVPLLVESGWTDMVDEVWLVTVERQEQMERLMKRNGLSYKEAQLRINSQMPLEEKRKYADRIIDNSGNVQNTYRQVDEIWQDVTANLHEYRRNKGWLKKS